LANTELISRMRLTYTMRCGRVNLFESHSGRHTSLGIAIEARTTHPSRGFKSAYKPCRPDPVFYEDPRNGELSSPAYYFLKRIDRLGLSGAKTVHAYYKRSAELKLIVLHPSTEHPQRVFFIYDRIWLRPRSEIDHHVNEYTQPSLKLKYFFRLYMKFKY